MPNNITKITADTYYKFGCPKCGAKQPNNTSKKASSEFLQCPECKERFLVLAYKTNEPFVAIGNEEPDSEASCIKKATKKIIAISESDFCEYGCPACGDKYVQYVDIRASEFASSYIECINCNERFIILKNGIKQSLNTVNGQRPKLSKHPLSSDSKIRLLDKKEGKNGI